MGLLDSVFATPSDQALWALGSGLLGVRRGNEGRAAMGAMEAYNQAQQEQRRNKLTEAQLKEIEAQAAQRQAMADEIRRAQGVKAGLQNYLSGVGRPTYQPGATMMKPETMANPQMTPFDPAQYLALGGGVEEAQKLSTMGDWGKSPVARTVDVEGPKGEKLIQQLDNLGRPVGPPLPAFLAPQLVNQGDRQSFVKPQAGLSLPVGMSPEGRDASARGWQQLAIERERLAQGGANKPPPGYRWGADGGSLEAIPGGPADIKASADGQKAEARRAMAGNSANLVIDTIKEAKDLVGINTAGAGGYLAMLPATEARALQGKLLTIKSNLGFDRLQAMREASPTGGALGQVAVQELNSLQATVASLDQLQKGSDLKAALDKIEVHYNNWLDVIDPGRERKGGGGSIYGAPKVGEVVDGFRFKGGNPAQSTNWEKVK